MTPGVFAAVSKVIAEKAKAKRATNKEHRAAIYKAWYQKNYAKKRAYEKQYKADNKAILAAKRKEWTLANPEHVSELNRRSKRKSKRRILAYQKRRYHTDPNFRISRLMRCGIWRMAKFGWKKRTKCAEYIGCTFPELRAYIEQQFKPGMNWENHGRWEIDHKTPLSWFNLTDEDQVKKAWNYTNLQPLWRNENRTKQNRYAELIA